MAESENPLPSVEEAAAQAILFSRVLCPLYDSDPESDCDTDISTLSDDDDDDDDYHSLPPSPMASPPPEACPILLDSSQDFFDSCPMETDLPIHDGFESDWDDWVPTERGSRFSSEVAAEQGANELPDPIVPDSDELRISRFEVESDLDELIPSVFEVPVEMEADPIPLPDWDEVSQVTRPVSPDFQYFIDNIPDELLDCLPDHDPNPTQYPNPHPEPDWEAVSSDGSSIPDIDEMVRNLEWEVLLAMNNVYGSDPEITFFRQFLEQDGTVKGGPPASKSVVENLPNITVDETKGDLQCAVCKESILVGESVKRLPCSHDYHGICILPWLGIRNTCPLCRFELPTDDLEYESWRGRQENQV